MCHLNVDVNLLVEHLSQSKNRTIVNVNVSAKIQWNIFLR